MQIQLYMYTHIHIPRVVFFSSLSSLSQVLKDGAFGGTYYRKITSAVTGETYEDVHQEYPEEWFKGMAPKSYKNATYRGDVNKWGVECGGALDMWESSGWISDVDPYGWFQVKQNPKMRARRKRSKLAKLRSICMSHVSYML